MVEKVEVDQSNNFKEKLLGRKANFELLRLIAMLMVVSLHYLSKGQVLSDFKDGPLSGNEYLAYLLESFSVVAVNAFVLLSGYFLVTSEFKSKKVIQLAAQVLFYAILIPVVLTAAGVLQIQDMNIYTIFPDVFPIQTEHYWFATYYVFLYLCTPILNRAIKAMNQQQLKICTVLLLFVFSIPKSILPLEIPIDRKGYDLIWFICVYFVAAYIRLYGIPFLEKIKNSVFLYAIMTVLIFSYICILGAIFQRTGYLENQIKEVLHYNHILNLLSAIAFFYIFHNIKLHNGMIARGICAISPYAFGVYLLHEHIDIRYLWPVWCHVQEMSGTSWFLLHYITTVTGIFMLGIMVDWFRSRIFRIAGKRLENGRIDRYLRQLDQALRMKQ